MKKLTARTGEGATTAAIFAPEAYAEYFRCFRDPACSDATCDDYRAAAGTDIEHDDADGERKVEAPLRVLWDAARPVGTQRHGRAMLRSAGVAARARATCAGRRSTGATISPRSYPRGCAEVR